MDSNHAELGARVDRNHAELINLMRGFIEETRNRFEEVGKKMDELTTRLERVEVSQLNDIMRAKEKADSR